jgi:hypothetical protein
LCCCFINDSNYRTFDINVVNHKLLYAAERVFNDPIFNIYSCRINLIIYYITAANLNINVISKFADVINNNINEDNVRDSNHYYFNHSDDLIHSSS